MSKPRKTLHFFVGPLVFLKLFKNYNIYKTADFTNSVFHKVPNKII